MIQALTSRNIPVVVNVDSTISPLVYSEIINSLGRYVKIFGSESTEELRANLADLKNRSKGYIQELNGRLPKVDSKDIEVVETKLFKKSQPGLFDNFKNFITNHPIRFVGGLSLAALFAYCCYKVSR